MKKIIGAVVFTFLISLPAFAQQQKNTPEEKAAKMTEKMVENLGLSGEQKEAVYVANLEMTRSMQQDRDKAYKTNQEQLKEILTPEQYQKMQELRSQRKKGMSHRKHREIKGGGKS